MIPTITLTTMEGLVVLHHQGQMWLMLQQDALRKKAQIEQALLTQWYDAVGEIR